MKKFIYIAIIIQILLVVILGNTSSTENSTKSSKKSKTTQKQQQYKLCLKSSTTNKNPTLKDLEALKSNWKVVEYEDQRIENYQLSELNCNILDKAPYQFQPNKISDSKNYLINRLSSFYMFNGTEFMMNNTFEFDQQEFFQLDSKAFYQQDQPIKQKKQDEFIFKYYVLVNFRDTFEIFVYKKPSIIYRPSQKGKEQVIVPPEQFDQFVKDNTNMKLHEQRVISRKIKSFVTYMMLANIKGFMENANHFEVGSISFRLTKDSPEPLLYNIEEINIFRSQEQKKEGDSSSITEGIIKQQQQAKQELVNFLKKKKEKLLTDMNKKKIEITQEFLDESSRIEQKHLDQIDKKYKAMLDKQLKIDQEKRIQNEEDFKNAVISFSINQIEQKNFSPQQKLLAMKQYNFISIFSEFEDSSFIDELAKKHVGEKEELYSEILNHDGIVCFNTLFPEKTIPIHDWIQTSPKAPNYFILPFQSAWSWNVQKCDFIFLSRWEFQVYYNILNGDKQFMNYSRTQSLMHHKEKFDKMLKTYDSVYPYSNIYNSTEFYPETYYIDLRVNLNQNEYLQMKQDTPEPWIFKPTNSSQGIGIELFDSMQDAQQYIRKLQKSTDIEFDQYLIQKYISNAGLLHKKKFDYRCYILFASLQNEYEVVYFHEGYLRKSVAEYDSDSESDSKTSHITNIKYQIQGDAPDLMENITGSFSELITYLREVEKKTEEDIEMVLIKLKRLATYVAQSYIYSKKSYEGVFQHFGLDILFDDEWNPHILEANSGPQLYRETPSCEYIVNKFIDSELTLMTHLQQKASIKKKLFKKYNSLPTGSLELLFNRPAGYDYILQTQTQVDQYEKSKIEKQQKKEEL